MAKNKINTLSLFTGAGGLDIGFHQEGFNIIECIEIESSFCKTLELNRGKYLSKKCNVNNISIENFDPKSIKEKIDFVIGGPPCQSFSASGRRAGGAAGLNDNRGTLFHHYCRILKDLKPEGFLFENVRGLMGVNNGSAWKLILSSFDNLGYKLSFRLLDSALYGAPQHRERIILIGAKSKKILFPFPTHGPQSKDNKEYLSARSALAKIKKNDLDAIPKNGGGKYDHLINEIPPGLNYSYFTEELGHPKPVFAWRSKFSDFLYKADPKKPVKTLQASPGKYSGPFHWKSRKMTISELKRLQTFPDDYKFYGKYNNIVKQIGNSVVPQFGRKLAQAVRQQLFKEVKKNNIPLMDENFDLVIDNRKSIKARRTRLITRENKSSQTDLFLNVNRKVKTYDDVIANTYILKYNSYQNREKLKVKPKILSEKKNTFYCVPNVSKGICKLEVKKIEKSFKKILTINLDFNSVVIKGLRGIECSLFSDNINDFVIGWDFIELFILDNSSFSSIIDLYGHFAEPRPKFNFNFINHRKGKSAFTAKYFEFINDSDKVSKFHPIRELVNLSDKKSDAELLIKELQELRFDIRFKNNSPNINKDIFLPCYPFPRPYNKQTMVAKL